MKSNQFVRAITQVIALFLFVGCNHLGSIEGTARETGSVTRPPGAPLDLLYVSTRAAYLEPCGCSLRPLGGIRRQWNALQKIRDPKVPTFSLESGTTFVPGEVERKELKHFTAKAKFILDALNQLGVNVLSPSAEDFTLGAKQVQSLAKAAKFPFISANLLDPRTGKPYFPRYTVLEAPGVGKVLVTSVSLPLQHKWAAKEVKVQDPNSSLREVFRSTQGQSFALVVVLSGLSAEDRGALIAAHPQINLVLGSDGQQPQSKVYQDTPGALHADPLTFAKTIVALHFGFAKGWQAPVQPYNADVVSDAEVNMSSADNRIYDLKHELTLHPPPAEKKRLLGEKQRLENFIARMQAVKATKPGLVQYTYDQIDLEESWELPVNPMQAIYDRYLDSVHQAASLNH